MIAEVNKEIYLYSDSEFYWNLLYRTLRYIKRI